ncbi:MAG: hypothetical protein EOM50_01330 [Erysipelotrichia bacterium]|nr:hypothetical protein [Erysipelotrichia bacterium]NCC54819.1 hypothetical protein [Erysipelotrichia bacterium]
MDKTFRRLMGLSLEFNRLMQLEKEVSISEYLVHEGIPFCHYATYQKMLTGEYNKEQLYLDMMEKLDLTFDYDEHLQQLLREKYIDIKRDIECMDDEQLAIHLKEGKAIIQHKQNVYPQKIEYFILEEIEKFYVHRKIINDKEIKALLWIIKVASNKARAILIHLIYFNTHKRKALISTLTSVFESLPLFDKEEMLTMLVITRQMIYEKELDVALRLALKLEKMCLESKNYARLTEVYQDLIAIYGCLYNYHKRDYYFVELKRILEENSHLSKSVIEQSHYYLGMCSFSMHQFKEAYTFLEKQRLVKPISYALLLCYLSVASYLKKEIVLTEDMCSLIKLDSSNRVFLRYFYYKQQGKSEKELKSYIVDKVLPIIDEDYIMESYIFRQELYLMNAKVEFENFTQKMEQLKYVKLEEWELLFRNWLN